MFTCLQIMTTGLTFSWYKINLDLWKKKGWEGVGEVDQKTEFT